MIHSIIVPMLAGLAIFLSGMKIMELALQSWAGSLLQTVLETFTKTPARGMLASTGLTALLQSSTAVTVITIGLVNAGVMRFPQTLGVILGTNIGTCLTTELLGLQMNRLALPLLLSAFTVWMLSNLLPEHRFAGSRLRTYRLILVAAAGFACVLLGMEVMQSIMPELRNRGLFNWFVEQSRQSLLWGILAGAIVTAAIHSSAVTIAMAMGLAAVHAISPELGIAITIGANIGTCVTALIAGIGGSRFGAYVAWAHIILNIAGAVLFYPFIHQLEEATRLFAGSPSAQVAHAQTIFNVASSLIALPFCYLPVFRKIA